MPERPELPELEGVTHRTVRVGDVGLHVAEAGEGPVLVLLHGWPQNWWIWRELIGPLATRHRVICPDLRGFGWSEAPSGSYEKQTFADDLLGLMDVLEIERAGLIAHDWGGFAGFLACLDAPARFDGFLALAIAPPWRPPGRPDPRALTRLWYQAAIAAPVTGRLLVSNAGLMRRMLGRRTREVWGERELDLYTGTLFSGDRAHVSVGVYRSFLTRELPGLLRGAHDDRTLEVPTRLLVGDRDPVLTEDSLQGYRGHARDMTLEMVPGAEHFLPEQCPQLVLARAGEMFG